MNKKYLIAFVFSALLIGLSVMYFGVKYNTFQHYSNSSDDQNKTGQITVRQFEQNLFLRYRTYHNGPTETSVALFLSEKEDAAASYVFRGEFEKPEINLIYNANGLKCYEWLSKSTCIITYKYENSRVKAYPPLYLMILTTFYYTLH
ncbi:hypothetical protein [Ethanoligenens harbinense]|uniref:hypothetical protein n=1 Tax=Ethanoligenens harbinense TaxID=253239 RepID=UPI001FAB1D84|nr:hypothetical protein [Ethanoligenens harbinense]